MGVVVAGVSVLWFAGAASAHVDPTPPAVEAGTSAEVSFGIEHGCDGSPLVRVEIQVPDGVTDVEAVPGPDGWTGAVADGVVTFEGGPQPADEPIDVALRATFPDTAGETIGFPTVQTCEEGSISWIEPVVEGEEEPESPAPTVLLTDGPPTAEQLAPEEEGSDEGAAAPGDAATTAEPATTSQEDEGSSNTVLIAGIAVVAIAVVVGGVVLARRRSSGSGGSGA